MWFPHHGPLWRQGPHPQPRRPRQPPHRQVQSASLTRHRGVITNPRAPVYSADFVNRRPKWVTDTESESRPMRLPGQTRHMPPVRNSPQRASRRGNCSNLRRQVCPCEILSICERWADCRQTRSHDIRPSTHEEVQTDRPRKQWQAVIPRCSRDLADASVHPGPRVDCAVVRSLRRAACTSAARAARSSIVPASEPPSRDVL